MFIVTGLKAHSFNLGTSLICLHKVRFVPLLQFLFVYLQFNPHLVFIWCLGRVVLSGCAISWIFSLILLVPVQ